MPTSPVNHPTFPHLFKMEDRKQADRVSKALRRRETFKAHLFHEIFHPYCPLCVLQEEHARAWLEEHKAS